MSKNYEIGNVSIFQDFAFMRLAELRVFAKKVCDFVRAVDKNVRKPVLEDVTKNRQLINEIYIRLDLGILKKIDNDPELQKEFIQRNTRFLEEKALLNIFFIKIILKEGEELDKNDISYLNDLLLYQLNDIYIVPLIEFRGEISKPKRIEIYNKFVKDILEEKNSTVAGELRVGISIPSYYPRRKLEDLFSIYEKENKEPTFIVIDYAYQRPSDASKIGIIPRVNNYFLKEGNEKYFIYGFNVKPYKKGEESPIAEDIFLMEAGFNAVGGAYRHLQVYRRFPPPQGWEHINKIFSAEEYRYYPLVKREYRRELEKKIGKLLNKDIKLEKVSGTANIYVKQYNFHTLNNELFILSDIIRKNEIELLKKKLQGKETTKHASNLSSKILQQRKSRTLDDF